MDATKQAALTVQLHAQKALLQRQNKEIAEKDLEIKKLQKALEEAMDTIDFLNEVYDE